MKRTIASIMMAILLFLVVLPSSASAEEVQTAASSEVGVRYQTHIQDKGWENTWRTDGNLSGTTGESKRLEALIVELTGNVPVGANIRTYAHVQNLGDVGPFAMGTEAGTHGRSLRLENIRLVLNNLPGYILKYNVHVENKGWLRDEYDDSTWFVSGEVAGTKGQSLRLEGIKIKLVEVNTEWTAYNVALTSVSQADYTVTSWAVYRKIVDDNTVTVDNTKDEIKTATANIVAAQKVLVKTKNLTAYNAVLASVKEADYTPATWRAYQVVIKANTATLANTQTQIDAATAKILLAQKKLQRKVNLTEYYAALAAVREADYTAVSWATYKKVVAANMMTEANTQVAVNAAAAKIVAAQKTMVKKFDFTAYNALLAAVKKDNYTTLTWGIYKKVVDANAVTENDTQTDIETAIKKIAAAQKKLVKAGDMTTYNIVAAAVKKADYTTVSWATYQKIAEATVVSRNNTQTEIDAATTKLLVAQLKLVGIGDLTEYTAALAAVKKADYTTASWATYQKVLDSNVVTPASGQTAIDAAMAKIKTAQLKLVKTGSITAYNVTLAAVKETDYTPVSWGNYQKVVKANVMTADKGQTIIDAAVEKIIAAQQNLVKKGNLTAYNAALAGVKETDYTSASWTIYQKILDANEMSTDQGQTVIDVAVTKITSAQKKLVIKGGIEGYKVALARVSEEDYTVASWTIYKKVLAANVMTTDKSQTEINAAIAKIETAQLNLVKKGDITAYEAAVAKYDGKEDDYTTKSWTAYQTVLDANIMTTENNKAQIEAAIAKIANAQGKLVLGAKMTYYNEVLSKYEGKQAEYTLDSWAAYQAVVLKNLVTKDNTQTQVNTATVNIDSAQKSLVRATDLGAFKAALDLYQENLRTKMVSPLATTVSWSAYVKQVEYYASFDANGDWVPGRINEATEQIAVNAATELINTARNNLLPSNSDVVASFVKYDDANKLPTGHVADDYTLGSYALYINECAAYQFPIRIKASAAAVNAAADSINAAKSELKLRATEAETQAFLSEAALYSTLIQSNYTSSTWEVYKSAYVTYYDNPITCLDRTKNTASEYEAGRNVLANARLALKPAVGTTGIATAESVSQLVTKDRLEKAGVTEGKDLVASAQSLINTEYGGFSVTLAVNPATPNVGVDATGKVTDGIAAVTISFTVTQDAYPDNNFTITVGDLSVS